MTRINVGVLPSELCDQHLLAEIRELPRCFAYGTTKAPNEFTLGKGHVLWCARFHGSLLAKLRNLYIEARHRNFNVVEREPKGMLKYWTSDDFWSSGDEAYARTIIIDRIVDRMTSMIRKPRWTNRQPPCWAYLNECK